MRSDQALFQNGFVCEQDLVLEGLVHYIFHPHNWKFEYGSSLQDLFLFLDCVVVGLAEV